MRSMFTPPRCVVSISSVVGFFLLAAASHGATVVWNGAPMTFSKGGLVNVALPVNQDRITSQVWLTRGNTNGIFNIFAESSFSHFQSPSGTEWAFGTTANYASLTYTDWESWTNLVAGGPPGTIGKDAVVRLHDGSDEIYLDLKFTSWGVGGTGGGAFSYIRSTAPVPEVSSAALLGIGLTFLSSRRRREH